VQEIFAVQVLRGMRFPELLEWNDQHLGNSYVLPDEALADVVLPPEQIAIPNARKLECRDPKFETDPNESIAKCQNWHVDQTPEDRR
jgi:hypothetical protein